MRRERHAFFFPRRELGVVERDDAAVRVVDHRALGLAEVADADLHELADAVDLASSRC